VGMAALGEGRAMHSTNRTTRSSGSALHYIALGIQNQALAQTLAQRVSENLRSCFPAGFYDTRSRPLPQPSM